MKANTVKVLEYGMVRSRRWDYISCEDQYLQLGFNARVGWLNFIGWKTVGVNVRLWDQGKIIGDRDENQTPTKMWV